MRRIALVLSLGLLAGCSGGSHPLPSITAPSTLRVTSPDLADGGAIPVRFTCDGADEAPVIRWSGGRENGEMVLVMTDPDANGFVHWVTYGFGGSSGRIGDGIRLGQDGRNDFGTNGYRGPCPPPGDGPHRYLITLYEFEPAPSPVVPGERPDQVLNGVPVAEGMLTGTYARR